MSTLYTDHAALRLEERLGVRPNKTLCRRIIAAIQQGEAEFLDRRTCDRSRWRVTVDGVTYRVVYSNRHHKIITFLDSR